MSCCLYCLYCCQPKLPGKCTISCCRDSSPASTWDAGAYYCRQKVFAKAGDTCASLAAAASLPLPLVRHFNPGVDCDALEQDQIVCLNDRRGCGKAYGVAGNDTCDSIASRHGLTAPQLLRLNPGLDCSSLVLGWPVCVWPEGSDYIRGELVSNHYAVDPCWLGGPG